MRPRFGMILLGAVALGMGGSCGMCALREAGLRAQLEALAAQRDALKESARELHRQMEHAATDEFAERIAREELNMIYPGEIRYISD